MSREVYKMIRTILYDQRKEISVGLAIINIIRQNTSININELTKILNINRATFYESANGRGTRHHRVLIALLLNAKPSIIWPNRSEQIKQRDDNVYEIMQGGAK